MFDVEEWLQNNKPIKLCKGLGTPETGGCWMSALSQYADEKWTDRPECVCPIVREVCTIINDSVTDEVRGELVSECLFDPLGTNTDNEEVLLRRVQILIDADAEITIDIMKQIDDLSITDFDGLVRSLAGDYALDCEMIYFREVFSRVEKRLKEKEIDNAGAILACLIARRLDTLAQYCQRSKDIKDADVSYDLYTRKLSDLTVNYFFPILKKLIAVGNKTPMEMQCSPEEFGRALQIAE